MTLAAVCPQAEPPPSAERAIEVFRTVRLKLRPLTGRKARVLEWTRMAYEAAVTATLAELDLRDCPVLDDLVTGLPRRARAARQLVPLVTLPAGSWDGLHSSLRAAAVAAGCAQAASYWELRALAQIGRGDAPTWPGDAKATWPDLEDTLQALAELADDEAAERALTADLMRASFRSKEDRQERATLWFPRLDGARRSRNAALLTDGRNYWLLAFLLAPNHPDAQRVTGSGTLREVGGTAWTGRSQCALVFPLETDRHEWERHKYLLPADRGEQRLVTGQLIRRPGGEWAFHLQCATTTPLLATTQWLGLAFDRSTPVLVDQDGTIVWTGSAHLKPVALLGILDRAGRQQRGQDVSYHRPSRVTGKAVAHRWANEIAEIAAARGAHVAIPGGKRHQGRPGQPQHFLQEVLTYKLGLRGLTARLTSAKDAPWRCPQCDGTITLLRGTTRVRLTPLWYCESCQLWLPGPGVAVAWHLARRAAAATVRTDR